ncbi:MAG: hypothetical protein Q8S35_00595 [bacterium]|nr:hypothetical protein [bacterium]
MIPCYVVLNKKLGQTPLQAIDAWRLEHPEHKDAPATYAGRLDPMATGELLVLLGEECKRQEAYRGLDKEYEIEILLDFSTDTGDILGMPTYSNTITLPSKRDITRTTRAEIGTKEVPYPAFSSKTVDGKPLFLHALEGTLDSISIPTHEERIYSIKHVAARTIEINDLRKRVIDILSLAPRTNEPSKELGADFRQDEIGAAWLNSLSTLEDRGFVVLTLTVTCASGTYMRSLAERIGIELGTQAVALSIHRTRVGQCAALPFGLCVWIKTYT